MRPKRRVVIWTPESDDLTAELATKLKAIQAKLDAIVDHQIEQAKQPRTLEYNHLLDLNREIEAHNKAITPGVRKGRKQRFKPERLYVKERFTRDHKKGGLDAVFYAYEIYEKHLFPYYEEVKRLNPNKQVFIVEDNVGVHHKARRIMAPLIAEKNIQFLTTPANSPDLNPIEHLHRDQKAILQEFRMTVISSAKVVQEAAEIEMLHVWQDDEDFARKVAKRASLDYIQGLCKRAKESEPPYGNRYKDSL